MDKSPDSQQKPADIPAQEVSNKPLSGERPGQGDAMTNDHYDPRGKPDADKRIMTAPDTLGGDFRDADHLIPQSADQSFHAKLTILFPFPTAS